MGGLLMEFRIADTFTDSLARLTGDEQKLVKTTAFDLQLNPSNLGMRFHRLHKAKDKNFWAVRASGDLRLVVHRSPDYVLLCYVDHHDKAYDWAQRRKLETHPTTGAAQLVETFASEADEIGRVGQWLSEMRGEPSTRPMNWRFSCGPLPNASVRSGQPRHRGWPIPFWMNTSKPFGTTCRSAPCTLPRGWNSGGWW